MLTPLRVLMIARPNLYSVPGGDTVQINETAKALRAMQVEVDIIVSGNIDYSRYDLIHFFNIIDPEDILGHIFKSNLPYVVSTIYVDYREYDRKYRVGAVGKLSRILSRDTIEYLKTLAKFVFKKESVSTIRFFLKGHRKSIIYIANRAAILLPNSENEYRRLKEDYGINQDYCVVPNAINTNIFNHTSATKEAERDIVLCVARIEGQKNQLNVIRALKDTDFKVVFVGAASPNQPDYIAQCHKEATENMQFIPHLPQSELLQYYNRAKVHVLASWFETTGLSNLEAGVLGCNLVVGKRGDVTEYFENFVYYCDPEDINSIKDAVNNAWNKESSEDLKQHILNNFTWERAAKITLTAYKNILNR
jgi:glycosyltransferase involved in cell wall biosynthesis